MVVSLSVVFWGPLGIDDDLAECEGSQSEPLRCVRGHNNTNKMKWQGLSQCDSPCHEKSSYCHSPVTSVIIVLVPLNDAEVIRIYVIAVLIAALLEFNFVDLAAVVVILLALETVYLIRG